MATPWFSPSMATWDKASRRSTFRPRFTVGTADAASTPSTPSGRGHWGGLASDGGPWMRQPRTAKAAVTESDPHGALGVARKGQNSPTGTFYLVRPVFCGGRYWVRTSRESALGDTVKALAIALLTRSYAAQYRPWTKSQK